jgi:hypothetical protein
MKKIIIDRLEFKNFKGIKELSLNFEACTNIKGDNATGKTTVFDGFTWLLFDKDSADRQNFHIKTLDCNNEVLHGLEHQVGGVLNVDGKVINLTKIFKEKWTKKRGEANRQLTGHETLYYIDQIPVKQSEYRAKVNSFMEEKIFKLITNPLCFSTNIGWQDRRAIVLEFSGDISKEQVFGHKSSLKKLEKLLFDKDVDALKKSIAFKIKKLNENIKAIPYRIDELNNSLKKICYKALDPEASDYETLDSKKQSLLKARKSIEDKLMDSSKANEENLKHKDNIYAVKTKLREIEYSFKLEAEKPLKDLEKQLSDIEMEVYRLENQISSRSYIMDTKSTEIETLEQQMTELRENYNSIKEEPQQTDKNLFICQTCRRPLEAEDIIAKKQELEDIFEENKAKRLLEINILGKGKKKRAELLQEELNSLKEQQKGCEAKLSELNSIGEEKKIAIEGFKSVINQEGSVNQYWKVYEEGNVYEDVSECEDRNVYEDISEYEDRSVYENGSVCEAVGVYESGQVNQEEVSKLYRKALLNNSTIQYKNAEYQELLKELSDLEGKAQGSDNITTEINDLKNELHKLQDELDEVNKQLNSKEQNEKIKERIKVLLEEEESLTKEIAELEGEEILCEDFIKTKVELLEDSINKKFKFVKFKLFNTLVNGAVEECCEALINGVPFGSANKASQINAGLDIINALSEYYGVQAPIFIDNREGINHILECNSQIINLSVSQDKALIIEGVEAEKNTLQFQSEQQVEAKETSNEGYIDTRVNSKEIQVNTIEISKPNRGNEFIEGPEF